MGFQIQKESDADSAAPFEIQYNTYPTFTDLINGTNGSGAILSQLGEPATYSTTGLAYDGTQYIVQKESDADSAAPFEIQYNTYPTFTDLINGTNGSGAILSQLGEPATYSTTGLAYDGTQYIVQKESDADSAAPFEIQYNTYPTFTDLINGTNGSGAILSQLGEPATYSTTGLAYDGTQYIVQKESDADSAAPFEIQYNTYPTFTDLINGTNGSGAILSQLGEPATYSTTGLAYDGSKGGNGGNGAPIPEPSTVLLFGTGLAGLAAWRWKTGKQA